MNRHPSLPLSGLSRRAVVGRAVGVGAALGLGGRLGRALAQDATPPAGPVEFLWETRGDPASPLGNPAHLAIAPDGTIWVADGDNNRFQIFAPDGSLLEVWGTPGSGEGEFDFTTIGWGGYDQGAIAFAPDGAFYVADPGNHRIQKFGPDRGFLTAWGSEGREPGQFNTPIDLVVDGQGRVYVVDSYRNVAPADPGTGAVQVFDADGRFLAEWGERGAEPGQLDDPFGIGLDPDGTLLVAEFDNNRVQRFTPEGEVLDGWGGYGIADGEFVWAMDAAVDAAGARVRDRLLEQSRAGLRPRRAVPGRVGRVRDRCRRVHLSARRGGGRRRHRLRHRRGQAPAGVPRRRPARARGDAVGLTGRDGGPRTVPAGPAVHAPLRPLLRRGGIHSRSAGGYPVPDRRRHRVGDGPPDRAHHLRGRARRRSGRRVGLAPTDVAPCAPGHHRGRVFVHSHRSESKLSAEHPLRRQVITGVFLPRPTAHMCQACRLTRSFGEGRVSRLP